MGAIRRLDSAVSGQLKSQLLVDSVESVVRELVHNSMDAGATEIQVKLDLPSLSVCVEDNGSGLSSEELNLVGKRYYTSKLESLEELGSGFQSYGFRGEALSSIAACCSQLVVVSLRSHTVVQSSELSEPLLKVLSDFFQIAPKGTAVMASRIFSPTPVRWALVNASEGKVTEELRKIIFECLVGHLKVGILVFFREPDNTFRQALSVKGDSHMDLFRSAFGISQELVRFEPSSCKFTAEMFISLQPTQRRLQFFFLQGRKLLLSPSDRASISQIFKEAGYGRRNMPGLGKKVNLHPIIFFNIEGPIDYDDLLQDPAKAIARPGSWLELFEMIKTAFNSFLLGQAYLQSSPSPSKRTMVCADPLKTPEATEAQGVELSTPINKEVLRDGNFRVVRQISSQFILLVMGERMCIIDQHACAERIQVEEYLEEFVRQVFDPTCDLQVRLRHPILLSLSDVEMRQIFPFQDRYRRLGISYEVQDGILVVTHLPLVLSNVSNPNTLKATLLHNSRDLRDWANNLEGHWFLVVKDLPPMIVDAINSLACRRSIKFGDVLTIDEMHHLVQQLGRCQLPFQCAHGRPTILPLVDLSARK